MNCKKLILISYLFLTNSCSYPEIIRDDLIYENTFENNDLTSILGGSITDFNNTKVIGNFNNDGFTIHIDNVGEHDYFFISFDLYIHGTWDGNFNGFDKNDKPDKWIMEFKPDMALHKDSENDRFITTFSNSPCWSNYCLRQSYPQPYPFENNPRKGNDKTDLPEICENNFFGGKTTLYKIEKGFMSSGNSIIIRFYDELYQPNAIDKDGSTQEKCDESWSMDNIKVRVVDYN